MTYLQINLNVASANRPAAAAVYARFKDAFLAQVPGARSKELLIRDDDVQVLHRFDSTADIQAYLNSAMFNDDIVTALQPLLQSAPDVRIYQPA